MKYTELITLENFECRRVLGALAQYLHSGTICASREVGVGLCDGDSGSPLVIDDKLIGIATWTITPCGLGDPNAFTRISAYLIWIHEKTGIPIETYE